MPAPERPALVAGLYERLIAKALKGELDVLSRGPARARRMDEVVSEIVPASQPNCRARSSFG